MNCSNELVLDMIGKGCMRKIMVAMPPTAHQVGTSDTNTNTHASVGDANKPSAVLRTLQCITH